MFKSLGNPAEKKLCGICIGCSHEFFMKLCLFSYVELFSLSQNEKEKTQKVLLKYSEVLKQFFLLFK